MAPRAVEEGRARRLRGGPLSAPSPAAPDRLYLRNVVYFAVLHLLPLGALVTGVHRRDVVAAIALYWIRIWFVTAGYHCYFAHRTF